MVMPHEFETRLRSQGYPEPATVTRDKTYALNEHSHPFDACALVTQGCITVTVDGQSKTYAAGDVFELAANTLHAEAAGTQGVVYLAGRRTPALNTLLKS